MRPFEDWFKEVLSALDQPKGIRNWTREDQQKSSEFTARTYRSIPREEAAEFVWAGPNHPEELIICTPLLGGRWKGVGRKGLMDIYPKWWDYRNGKLNRRELGGPTPYEISILKEFERLMEEQ